MNIWRISNYADLSGQGGLFAPGRWHKKGTPIVYAADHPSTALVEFLVHVDLEDLPADFQLLQIAVPDSLVPHTDDMPQDWMSNVDLTAQIGTQFIASRANAIMRVPSVLVPFTDNFLLNPALLAAASVKIVAATRHPIDARLLTAR